MGAWLCINFISGSILIDNRCGFLKFNSRNRLFGHRTPRMLRTNPESAEGGALYLYSCLYILLRGGRDEIPLFLLKANT